ncbi:sensor domain-containing diguanylate cyclase [Sedimenticola sp.]|uniref:sensor domain-containing diguanylate cyclase n=1 Tax=Sedimenticola sp. TaxID=1940285 RepID=UPI00258E0CBE|nr:sensor domain-containing diguanylate cyclase [Sedimenticola sp.]MCW8904816.1 sensor domain-containing diguanylate cyclase [Sedimenticola sp.]
MTFGQQDHFFSLVDSLSAIRLLSRMPIEGVSEQQFLDQALEALIEYQDLEQCSIFLLEGDVLRCTVGGGVNTFSRRGTDDPSADTEGMRFTAGEGIMGLALQSGQIQYCRNCKTDSRFKPFSRTTLFYGDGSLISAPIVSDDEVLGVLNVSHHQPEFFQTWHQHFFMLFANFLGRLLHLHRLVNRLEDQVASRTHALAQSLEESEKLRILYQELSVTDELTGLYNRRHFFIDGQAMLARAVRYDHPVGLMLIEVDQLKSINDQWGHLVGDQAICRIAKTLQKEARTGDLVARLGDGEFVLMLPYTLPAGMESMAARIQEAVSNLDLLHQDETVDLTVSIGMTTLCELGDMELQDHLDLLYHQADSAVDRCKREGGGQRLFYSPALEL